MTVVESYLMIKAYAEILGISETRAIKIIEEELKKRDNIDEIVNQIKKDLLNNRIVN